MATRTNLIPNPSAETNLNSITAAGGATIGLTATGATAGSQAVSVTCNGSAGNQGVGYLAGTPEAWTGVALPFTGSVDVAGSGEVRIYGRITYTDATSTDGFTGAATATLTGTPQRLVAPTLTSNPAKIVSGFHLYIRTTTAQAVSFTTDAAMMLQDDATAAYFDGDSPNAEWTGTPHASTSVLTIPRISQVLKLGSPHVGPLRVGQKG